MSDNKARLDPNGTAKGKTQIIAHHRAGDCVLPGINAISYEVVCGGLCDPMCDCCNRLADQAADERYL